MPHYHLQPTDEMKPRMRLLRYRGRPNKIACGIFALGLGCGGMATHPIDAPRTQMSMADAQKSLVYALSQQSDWSNLRDVKFTRRKVTYKHDRGPAFKETAGQTDESSITFANVKKPTTTGVYPSGPATRVEFDGANAGSFPSRETARAFVDALLVLKAFALLADTESADFAAFTAAANVWLATTPKPEMSEEARTYKLLAEDAVRRKEFSAALEAYRTALHKDPMWPEGQYNAALLAAEAEDYESAANYMRRYLLLAPNAKDAPAARDILLIWQHKAKQ